MEARVLRAILLACLLTLSGCMGAEESTPVNEEPEKITVTAVLTPIAATNSIVGGMVTLTANVAIQPSNTLVEFESVIHTPSGIRQVENTIVDVNNLVNIVLIPDEPGIWNVTIRLVAEDISEPISTSWEFLVQAPDEGVTLISMETIIEVEIDTNVVIEGNVMHENIDSCSLNFATTQVNMEPDGTFSYSLGIVEESYSFTLTATCGIWTETIDERLIRIIVTGGDDLDGDGYSNDIDQCPDGYGEEEGWVPNDITDYDSDGCYDYGEDVDDDNDGIIDFDDNCISVVGWISNETNDHDLDGCSDNDEDTDDDNDGITDELDTCPTGYTNWENSPYTDWDGDGCHDFEEDIDDDNDLIEDSLDACWRGKSNWDSTSLTDYDTDGCRDSDEDQDDDNDGVNDVNSTGVLLDLCPYSPLNATDIDEHGCDSTERDSDNDGVVDAWDECQGTPMGIAVNNVGCADLDGDGVFSNVDNCSNTMQQWTPDIQGCAVYQNPIPWKQNGHGSGRMDTVSAFSVPTLDGSWSFQTEWTGHEIYLFLFKYTDSSGNGNNAEWSSNPGSMIRKLPDNAHLFYGSFDSTFHNDVIGRENAVLATLSTSEEEKYMPRIHFIDQDMSNANGGLGDLINSWGSLYYGIDRFQRAREIGSIYAWTSSSNDISHWAYETRMYNYEFMQEIRSDDPNVETVTIANELWHSGGWQGGYTSTYENVTIDLQHEISQYDTLEIFHEHACEDRRNRYQNSDGSYGGCHEWDYLAYLKICDANNSSSCGTEFVRWITTYGREGRWITDITPYLFMLEENQQRTFKYQGANKGSLTMKLYFSNWTKGEIPVAGERMFTGGEFAGEYNNESRYTRQYNFTTPADYYHAKIIATITGHGFNQDQENCAEFCDHEHHYFLNSNSNYEWHPIVHNNQGCENEVDRGVVANQFGTWPYGRAGWCAGQHVEQWTYDITDWIDNSTTNNLKYKGLFQGQEYVPQNTNGGSRTIRAEIWIVWYDSA
ncbi:MAG: peptide-N-glycosidase F-related protein [Candidatus Poseidoniaceae archaeon]|jgi:hypothetical protein|nr:peptide-N-glycosidase F-related protein [Candidatus Poseidoniaceae archaeon]